MILTVGSSGKIQVSNILARVLVSSLLRIQQNELGLNLPRIEICTTFSRTKESGITKSSQPIQI